MCSYSLLQGNLPNPGMQPGFPASQADSLRLSRQGSPSLTFPHRAPKIFETSWAASSFSESFIVNPLQACLSILGPRWIHNARGGMGGLLMGSWLCPTPSPDWRVLLVAHPLISRASEGCTDLPRASEFTEAVEPPQRPLENKEALGAGDRRVLAAGAPQWAECSSSPATHPYPTQLFPCSAPGLCL